MQNDARSYIKNEVDIVADTGGGEGVLRDIVGYILDAQGLLEKLITESKKEQN